MCGDHKSSSLCTQKRGFQAQHSELFPFTAHLPVFVAAGLSFGGIIATSSSDTAQSRRGTSVWWFPLLRSRQMLWHATFLVRVLFHYFLHPIFQWWWVKCFSILWILARVPEIANHQPEPPRNRWPRLSCQSNNPLVVFLLKAARFCRYDTTVNCSRCVYIYILYALFCIASTARSYRPSNYRRP